MDLEINYLTYKLKGKKHGMKKGRKLNDFLTIHLQVMSNIETGLRISDKQLGDFRI